MEIDFIEEAKKLFNETWDLLDKQERTTEDDAMMLHKAHTSCYLWKSANSPVNDARGEWQVSRVYRTLGYGKVALLHATRSLEICQKHGVGDFDLAFGYEAVARAHALCGDSAKANENKNFAIDACEHIEKDDDKAYALGEINNIA